MKKILKYKYLWLTMALLTLYFLLTGGITYYDGQKFPAGPEIESFEISPSPVSLYENITFTVGVKTMTYYKDNDDYCDRNRFDDVYERLYELKNSIQITKDQQIIIDDEFTKPTYPWRRSGYFTYKTTFDTPGLYYVTATFISHKYGEVRTTVHRDSFSVVEGGEIVLQQGQYNLTRFSVKCASNEIPLIKTTGLDGNYFTISDNSATINVDISFSNDEVTNYPCLENEYNFNRSGNMKIVKEDSQYKLKIEYESDVYATMNFQYDGTELSLSHTDDDGNEYRFTFRK